MTTDPPTHSPNRQDEPNLSTPAAPPSRTTVGDSGIGVEGNVENAVLVAGQQNQVTIQQILNLPRTLYVDLREYLFPHWPALLMGLALQVSLALLFWRLKDRYLLAWEFYGSVALLLMIATIGWLRLWYITPTDKAVSIRLRRVWLTTAVVTTLLALALVGRQAQRLLFPLPLPENQFGIVIATLGNGPTNHTNALGRELTTRLEDKIQQALNNSEELSKTIAIRRIGVLSADSQQADWEGERLDADLVIWGSLVMRGNEVDVHFKLLQSTALLDNPAFPQHIPVTEIAVENTITLPYQDSEALKAVTEAYSLGIASFSLGLARYQKRAYPEALTQFERALTAFTDAAERYSTPTPSTQNIGLLYYYLGRCYQILGRFTDSQAMFVEAARYNPKEIAVLLGQIYNYRVFGEEAARKAAYQQVITLSTQLPAESQLIGAYNRALAFEQLEEYAIALKEYQSIIARAPDFFVAYLGAANLLTRQERFAEAEALYTDATAIAGDDPVRQIWLALGQAQLYEKSGRLEQALTTYLHAINLDTEHTVIALYDNLAQLYGKLGRKEDAIATYRALIAISYQPNWAYSVLAEYLLSIGDCPEAVQEYTTALQFEGNDQPMQNARLGLAYACSDETVIANHQALAITAFEKAIAAPSAGEAWIRHEYGRVLYQFGDSQGAIAQMARSLAIDTGPAIATRMNLGKLYEYTGAIDSAVTIYESLMPLCAELDATDFLYAQNRLEELGGDRSQCEIKPTG